uniref:Major vault protein n=1 Tax=Pipistrellus kuhlii TaxID=59472 RepID=A0A7J7S641_PIPKU|nr:major vault protein [Pipistrellus kuhlii]
MATEESIIRIPPYHYIHVLDQNSNVSRVEVGPKTYIRQDNERVLFAPLVMVTVPPRHYCTVANPVCRDAQGSVLFDVTGQVRLRHADLEIRLAQDPFPLYPGEVLEKDITPLQVVLPNTALHLKALLDFQDENGDKVVAGDEWLFEGPGTYIPRKEVEVVEIIQATVVRQNQALRLRARKECRDRDGKERVTGEEWLIRSVGAYLPAVFEKVLHKAGDHWLIRGPLEYVPSAKVEVVEERQTIPLDENEGIYVQDVKTGKVRAVIGSTYMLTEDEVLWEKELPPGVEELLNKGQDPLADRGKETAKGPPLPSVPRNKTRVVSYRVPHNAAVQVYDYREKRARVVFGPELVSLGPEEQFTVLSLSAGRPKRPHARRALCLLLGPDFFTDVITIETADHARLQLQLAYNWHFELSDRKDPQEAAKLFSVPDFVGDACKAIASRVRGAVASVTFDDFHKNSARIIRTAVFGFETLEPKKTDAEALLQPRDRAVFPQNGLVVSSVDVQSVEPVDQRTRDALQRSVQLAIEITTNSQEAAAKHEAQRLEQEARGRLERQKILDQSEAEKARRELLELEALSTAVESTGTAKAEAESRAEAARIEGQGSVLQAKLKAEALAIETEAELQRVKKVRELELAYARSQLELEVSKAQQLAEVEVKKFKQMTEALGPSTIRDLAIAGPEMQVKLLQSLGLKSTLITDGSTPINLFSTALGLLGLGSESQLPARKAAGSPSPSPEEHLLLHSSQFPGDKPIVP